MIFFVPLLENEFLNHGESTLRPKCVCEYTVSSTRNVVDEVSKSVDDLMTSQSIEGREFPDLRFLMRKLRPF